MVYKNLIKILKVLLVIYIVLNLSIQVKFKNGSEIKISFKDLSLNSFDMVAQ